MIEKHEIEQNKLRLPILRKNGSQKRIFQRFDLNFLLLSPFLVIKQSIRTEKKGFSRLQIKN